MKRTPLIHDGSSSPQKAGGKGHSPYLTFMKKLLKNQWITLSLLLAAAPLAATAQTTFFSDNFTGSSTVNQAVDTNAITGNSTMYETYFGLPGPPGDSATISSHDLSITFTNGGGLLGEVVALFTNTPVALTAPGDYIALQVVFVNTSNILSGTYEAGNSTINIGLFNSGGTNENQGLIILNPIGTTNAIYTGGTEDWVGYFGRLFYNGSPDIETRPVQTANGTTSQNQDLLFKNASSTQAFNSPNGVVVGHADTTTNYFQANPLTMGSTYTMEFVISFATNGPNCLSISNALYAGAGTGGTLLYAMTNQLATNAVTQPTFLTAGFDGLAVGWRNSSSPSQASAMDISSIQITGQSTPVSNPPSILTQPSSVLVATNGSCAFVVSAAGFGMTYQWHRNTTNLLDGGNISGSTKNMLVISPAGTDDAASGTNGYYVTITGIGNSGVPSYSTNSLTNSLALIPATNLIWNGGTVWDVNGTADWKDTNGNGTVFNYGDPVTFNDSAAGKLVTLQSPYLGAASITMSNTFIYTFQAASLGGFAGPGNLLYEGSGKFAINNGNTYTGGTLISNALAYLTLGNLNGLGSGPVTNAVSGAQMEIVPAGSASSYIPGDLVIADNLTILFDGSGSYAGDFGGNLWGTAGKTLTFTYNGTNVFTTTNASTVRIRIAGTNTTYNANLALSDPVLSLAPYNASGSQTYNGVISGPGLLIQRGNGTTILNGANTYGGGTIPSTGRIGFGTNTVGTGGAVTSGPIGTNALFLTPEVAGLSGNGEVFASGGARTNGNLIQYPSATNSFTLIIGGTNNLTFSGPFTLNGLDVTNGLATDTNNIRTLQVTNSALTIFSGVISDSTNGVSAGCGLIITGGGTNHVSSVVVLNNTETYTGPTTVTNWSTLEVNGSLNASSAVTVSSNGTLSGTGTINGSVTVNAGGTLAPGDSIGTITLGSLTNNGGNLLFEINTLVAPSNDYVVVTGILTNSGAGTLTVTNLGTTASLVAGDKFKLFSKALGGAGTLTTNLPALTAGLVWSNSLAADGSLAVVSASSVIIPTNSPSITSSSFSLISGNLTLNGTNAQSGGTYYLLSSTNVALPLSNWITVWTNVVTTNGANNAFTYIGTNVITPGAGHQFYILSSTNK